MVDSGAEGVEMEGVSVDSAGESDSGIWERRGPPHILPVFTYLLYT